MRRLLRWPLLLLANGLLLSDVYADSLQLPANIQCIEADSFAGCRDIETVILPDGISEIGDRGFAGCERMREITIPSSVERLGEDCLLDCGEALLVHCEPDSAAYTYAFTHGLDYDAQTQCRALVAGLSYTGTDYALQGTINDAQAMRFCLTAQEKRSFSVTVRTNPDAQDLLESIGTAFEGASENDISLFYYSGHGEKQGQLIGNDENEIYPAELRSVLDEVPGRKIIIIDACYSGNWIEEENDVSDASHFAVKNEEETAPGAEDFAEAFLSAFSRRTRSRANTGEYYIIVSAGATEQSQEGLISSGSQNNIMGFFTYAFCMGCGWDGVRSRAGDRLADRNSDGAVSVAEAYTYARASALENNPDQTAVTNAEMCTAFAPFR